MTMRILLPILALAAASCQSRSNKYYNKDLWKAPGGFDHIALKGSPRTVIETFCSMQDNIVTSRPTVTCDSSIYQFDRDGNLISTMIFDSGVTRGMTCQYTPDGYTKTVWSDYSGITPGAKMRSESVCLPLGGGKFVVRRHSSHDSSALIIRFSDNGNTSTIESYLDSAASGKPKLSITRYYHEQQLLKEEIDDPAKGKVHEQLFYSGAGNLDSIEYRFKGKVFRRDLFHNNEKGDPLEYIELAGSDTSMHQVFQYSYDAKGNWIMRKERVVNMPAFKYGLAGSLKAEDVRRRTFTY